MPVAPAGTNAPAALTFEVLPSDASARLIEPESDGSIERSECFFSTESPLAFVAFSPRYSFRRIAAHVDGGEACSAGSSRQIYQTSQHLPTEHVASAALIWGGRFVAETPISGNDDRPVGRRFGLRDGFLGGNLVAFDVDVDSSALRR